MFKATIIGNLGANAELHNENGSEFVTFKVAHNERFKSKDGSVNERSVWVSCILNGRADGLMPYLVKGATVALFGDLRLKTYHSAKMHSLVAGADLFVRSIDLVGSRPDTIPSRLYDTDGIEHSISKWYYCDTAKGRQLLTQSGDMYTVDANGWVSPMAGTNQPADDSLVDGEAQPTEGTVFSDGADVPSEGNATQQTAQGGRKTRSSKK